jgi:Ca-activated chloride channel family protein
MYALEKAFKKISQELRSQYIITYRPANQEYDGRKRRIEVRLKDREKEGKYRVRSKTEYRSVRDTLR